ncbi:hypothetical protein NERG_02213 [Nematocida ausubeli]|uniref:PFU domain-containing protein n=1 Tax=Nematocida ausubeli (strain ATCC PRA-371 / ERTm2) TaxID=1913371 RepID=H8ZF44_NEMA1|nr:hypothetical protein NERG_02213 [Nematocida ausubeli]
MAQIQVLRKIHISDIKDGVIYEDVLFTAGRDRVIRVSSVPELISLTESEDLGAAVNSMCFHKGTLYAGLQTGEIVKYAVTVDQAKTNESEKNEVNVTMNILSREKVHTDNVCSLSTFEEGVLSTSWDSTLGILRENHAAEIIRIESVAWTAKKVPNQDRILAGCIDGSVITLKKVNQKYTQAKGIRQHATCIRDMIMEENKYISVSNTGVVIVADLAGRVLHKVDLNNTSFRINPYTAQKETGYIVASDEGMVYILNNKLESLFSIAVPTLSCWSAVSKDSRIFALGADGRVYVFGETQTSQSHECQKELEELQSEITKDKTEAQNPTEQQGSEQQGNSPQYKVVDDKVYELKDGEWELFGSTVEKKKKDHTITITLGNANYSLSFDKTDKYEEVALGFVKENNLGTEYIPEIVEFLDKNFSGKKKRDISKYFVYDTINLEAVTKRIEALPDSHRVIEFLQDESTKNHEKEAEVEVILGEWLEADLESVAVLDIYKYLIAQGVDFNLSFLKHINPLTCKKTALAFSLIATNVLAVRPECKSFVDPSMSKIIDKQLVGAKILQNYKNNRRV